MIRIKKINIQLLLKIIVMSLFPFLCVLGICLINGKTFYDIYIPCSEWNDEMVYYKLTQSVIDFGIPQGFFGFNESHGIYLSFASWSPVLLLPWVIWGKIFGWSILSPVICNIVLLAITFLAITIMHRPSWKQLAFILVCFSFCSHFTRFIISCMSEATIWSLTLTIISLYIYDSKRKSDRAILISLVFLMLLCLMRPYFIIFFFYPIIRLKNSERRKFIVTILIMLVTVVLYYLINHYLSAPYLEDLYYTDWVISFKNGLFYGIKYTCNKLGKSFVSIIKLIGKCIAGDNTAGGLYASFFISFIIQTIHLILLIKKNEKEKVFLDVQILLASLLFFIAILLMYRLPEGGRHVLPYIFVVMINVCINRIDDRELFISSFVFVVVFFYFFNCRALSDFDFKVPFKDAETQSELQALNSELEQKMIITNDNNPSFDNTIIWIFSDEVDGIDTRMDFRQFYATPSGIGLNLCLGQYVLDNISDINSKYIGTVPNGDIDKKLNDLGKDVVARNDNIIIYQLY